MSNRYTKNPSTRNSKSPDLDLYVKGISFHLHKTLATKSAKVTTLHEVGVGSSETWKSTREPSSSWLDSAVRFLEQQVLTSWNETVKALRKRETENLECVAHCAEKKIKETKISGWREVKRKFGCMTSLTVDACNCHVKKRKKFHHYK
ncbi:unnamed protein product [Arabis nemorensis]|uniref:Uncharacterized protein n=1 Tax=Arabis nemorensis TaxID=586526 RepID=A0A565B6D4_9BRAS|nr:unnamed protein product [Arabis nemorensis]